MTREEATATLGLTISVMLSKRGVYDTSLFLPQRIEPIEVFPMVWLAVLHLNV